MNRDRLPRRIPVAARRRIIAVLVIAEFACLAVLVLEAEMFHRRGPLIADAVLLLGVVCGLNYLRSTGGRS